MFCTGTNDHIMPVSFAGDFERACEGGGSSLKRSAIERGGHWCDQFRDTEMCETLSVALELSKSTSSEN